MDATQSKYSKQLAQEWKAIKKPFPFVVDIVEFSEGFEIVVHRKAFANVSEEQELAGYAYLVDVQQVFTRHGIPSTIVGKDA